MTILVTGATGFLGSALVNELVQQEQSVRILARDRKKAQLLFGNTVEVIKGEILDTEKVKQAVDGVSTVYHLVGRLYHPSIPTELYRQTHVEGTRILLTACREQTSIQRIVHCSTTGVHGVTGDVPADEDAPFAPTNPYEATKLESELLALRMHEKYGLPISVIRPGLVYGPGDLHLLSFFRTIKKGLPVTIAGGRARIHPVYINDVTDAFLHSAEKPEAIGRSYNIAGERPVTFHELSRAIARASHAIQLPVSIPLWAANAISDACTFIPGLQGERAPLTRSRVQFLTNSRIYCIERAQNELGYRPKIGLELGMRLTAAWYQKHGYM